MSATDVGPISSEPQRRSYQLPRRLELALSALVVVLAGYWAPVRPRDPIAFIVAFRLWFALTVFFLWMTGLRVLRDGSTFPSAGEILGVVPPLFWLSLFGASCIRPNGGLTLSVFLSEVPIYFVTSLMSCGFLVATIAGKRRHVLYKFIDVLGLLVNFGSAVLFVIDLRLHPFFI